VANHYSCSRHTLDLGQSTIELVQEAGPALGLNALKWIQGNALSAGGTGFGFSISPTFDMSLAWANDDSLKFKMKVESGIGLLRIQFEGKCGKVGKYFSR